MTTFLEVVRAVDPNVWTAVSAVAASVSAALALWSGFLTRGLLRSASGAKIIVFVRHDLERPTLLTIVIRNIGSDVAEEVCFTPSRPVPRRAFGIEQSQATQQGFIEDGPLITGIPVLGPGDSREIDWGQYGGLSAALGGEPITLRFTYESGKRRVHGQSVLEVESYVGTRANEPAEVLAARASKESADALKSIAASLKSGSWRSSSM